MLDQALEQTLLADAPYVVACGLLALVQQGEIHAGSAQDPSHGLADFLIAWIERGIIADEPKHLGGLLTNVFDLEFQLAGPSRALACTFIEAVASVGDSTEGTLKQGIELTTFDQLAAHLHDHGWVFDADRTDLLAGAAAKTGPKRFGFDHAADEIEAVGDGPLGLVSVIAQVQYQIARAQRVMRCAGRTGFMATTAPGAGVQVQHVLP